MNPFLAGFADELIKTSGVLGWVGKHKMLTGMGLMVGGMTGMAATNAYRSGLQGGDQPRYLEAQVDPRTGAAQGSPAAYTNYHELFAGRPAKGQLKRLSGNYDEKNFKR